MKILIVCNNAFMRGNGVCTAVLSLADRLKARSIEARLMACVNPDTEGKQPEYPLKHFKFPFFEPIIYSNGFRYASFDKKIAQKAIEWADVVHLCEGFPLEAKVARLAGKMGKPCIGTYHIFTENIMANLGMRKARLLNYLVTLWWRKSVYDHCVYVHCPTETVKQHLVSNGFKSAMRVISNGIEIPENTKPAQVQPLKPIKLLCTGRLSNEKSQKTLLEAMRFSRYAHMIELHFAGKGPYMKRYMKLADRLVNDGVLKHHPRFGFYSREELKQLIRQAYLYIHCAWVEVEGLSCVEAIMEGTVPVIAKGKFTATHQFALDERSLFTESDSRMLAEKIDWWIEHPGERNEMAAEYAKSAKKYNADDSTDKIIQMYKDAIKK